MRYPLVDIKGNAGTLIESGNWAAMRYTESRLSKISDLLFDDIEKEWFKKVDYMKQITHDIKHECGEFQKEVQKGVSMRGVSLEELIKKKKMNEVMEYILKNPSEEIINEFLKYYDSSLLDSVNDNVLILQLANLVRDIDNFNE